MKYDIISLIKKMKAHQRIELLPLYKKQATYLLRAIKTAQIAEDILHRIEVFTTVATCHEVAINEHSLIELITHNNSRGVEAEYTSHPKAKNISRDLRVRIIWQYIRQELIKDITLKKFKIYTDIEELEKLLCPYCQDIIFQQNVQWLPNHADETANTYIMWEENTVCEHAIMDDNDAADVFYNFEDEIETIKNARAATNADIFELFEKYEIEGIYENGMNVNSLYFVEDVDDFSSFLEKELELICYECSYYKKSEEFEICEC